MYIYTDVNKGDIVQNSKSLDFIIFVAYKINDDILNSIISRDVDNREKDFLQILGYSQSDSHDIRLGFENEETEKSISRYYETVNDDLAEIRNDERAVSYIDKKINRLLSEKNIMELYEGLSGNKSKEDNYGYRITFVNGQQKNNVCCTLWYSDGTAYEKDPLTYFDMCVFDAVCTIWSNDRKQFYLNTIWELLSGNEDIRFSRNTIKDRIRDSVEKLERLRIMITDIKNAPHTVEDNSGEPILNVKRVQDNSGREFYEIKSSPVLWTYAVRSQEGQIARVPLYKLDGRRYFKWDKYECDEVSGLYSSMEDTQKREKMIGLMEKASVLDLEYKCSIWKVTLHFYLAHRLSIIKRKNKMNFINYNTIAKLMAFYFPETLKAGEEIDLIRKYCFCYMFWATLPKREDYKWIYKEYSDEKSHSPAGIVVKRIKVDNGAK